MNTPGFGVGNQSELPKQTYVRIWECSFMHWMTPSSDDTGIIPLAAAAQKMLRT